MLPIYYINLASRADRRDFMDKQLADLGLVGTRVDAVTPADLSAEEVAAFCDSNRPRYLRPKELSCTKSHERIWAMMIANGDERALILEDDAEVSPALARFLGEVEQFDYDMIRVEASGRRLRVFPVEQTTSDGVELRPFRSTPMGSAGYILTLRGAKLLLGHPGMRRRQTDLALYSPFEEPGSLLSRVQVFPAMVRQLGDGQSTMVEVARSDIDQVAEPHQFKVKHPLQFRWLRFREGLANGLRNAGDHFANRKRGLVRMDVPFAKD